VILTITSVLGTPEKYLELFSYVLINAQTGQVDFSSFRLAVPAQPVDATPSNTLIDKASLGEAICLAVLGQNLARVVFPPDLP